MWYHLSYQSHLQDTSHLVAQKDLVGYISAEPEPAGQRVWYVVTGESNGKTISVRVRADRYPEYEVGDFVLVSGTFEAAEPFETETGIFDYPRFLYVRGIFARANRVTIELSNDADFDFFGKTKASVLRRIHRFKKVLVRGVENVMPPREAVLVLGMVYGMKKSLSEEDEAAFKTSGLSHLVVLSGSNVAIVAGFLQGFVAFVPQVLSKYASAIPIVGVWLLVIMAGAEPSGMRAGIMTTLTVVVAAFATKTTQPKYKILSKLDILVDAIAGEHAWKKMAVLSGVAFGMAIWNPMAVAHDPSYALSFLATFGVTFVAPVLVRLTILLPLKTSIREVFAQTIAAQLCTLPVLLKMGGGQSLFSPLANALALPLVPIAMASGGAVSCIGAISTTTAEVPAVVAILATKAIYAIAAFFAVA